MEFIPYCAEEAFQFCFYQIPKELFTNKYYKGNLSSDAILLYALLLDRLSISRKRGWIDENGQYICSEIHFLATKIDELNKNIKLCNFIEERTLRMKDNVKEMSQEIKFKSM